MSNSAGWMSAPSMTAGQSRASKAHLTRIHLPFKHKIEIVEAVVLANDGPIVGEFILDRVCRSAVFTDVLAGLDCKAAGVAANAELGQEPAAKKNREPLSALLGSEGEGVL